MQEQQIDVIYRKNEESFIQELKHGRTLQERQVHELRAQLRNIYVLLHLLHSLSRGKYRPRKMVKMLNPLFELTGKFRVASLNIKLTMPYRSATLVSFKAQMKRHMERYKGSLQMELSDFKLKKFSRLYKESLDVFKSLKTKRVRKEGAEHLRVLLAEVRVDIFDIDDDETLHQIRDKVREIKIVANFLDQCGVKHPFTKEINRLKVTYERMTSWHDTYILIDELEDYLEDLEDEDALGKTMPLITVLKRKNMATKKQIEKRLKVDLVM
jgi:hypothetical protein